MTNANTIINRLRSDPKLHEKAMGLALRSKDESLSVVERMSALVRLNTLIESINDSTPNVSEKKPEYKWVNGARVRVK